MTRCDTLVNKSYCLKNNLNFLVIDQPILSEPFSPFYQVLRSEALNMPCAQPTVKNSELNRAELKELAYWKPETIGQIIFNY